MEERAMSVTKLPSTHR